MVSRKKSLMTVPVLSAQSQSREKCVMGGHISASPMVNVAKPHADIYDCCYPQAIPISTPIITPLPSIFTCGLLYSAPGNKRIAPEFQPCICQYS